MLSITYFFFIPTVSFHIFSYFHRKRETFCELQLLIDVILTKGDIPMVIHVNQSFTKFKENYRKFTHQKLKTCYSIVVRICPTHFLHKLRFQSKFRANRIKNKGTSHTFFLFFQQKLLQKTILSYRGVRILLYFTC